MTQGTSYKCEGCGGVIAASQYIEVVGWDGHKIQRNQWHVRCRKEHNRSQTVVPVTL